MAIRKTGAATGQVTEVEALDDRFPGSPLSDGDWREDQAAPGVGGRTGSLSAWDQDEEGALAAENEAADQ